MKKNFKQLYAFGEKLPIDMSLSENPLGCSPEVSSALEKLTVDVSSYPDPNFTIFKKKLAESFLVRPENIMVGNGSESLISLIGQVLVKERKSVIIPELTFPMFEIVSSLGEARVKLAKMDRSLGISLKNIAKLENKQDGLIFLCNPNNPTGNVIEKTEIIQFVKNTTSLVVVDEANIEFSGESVVEMVNQFPNMLVLRTFSKGFGLATLRVGVLIATKKIIEQLESIRPPFPISEISEKLCLVALEDKKFINKTRKFVNQERIFLTKELKKRNFKVFPSQANNLFIQIPKPLRGDKIIEKLAQKGVSVVRGSSFTGFSDDFMRVCPRKRNTNILFLDKLDEVLAET